MHLLTLLYAKEINFISDLNEIILSTFAHL